MADASLRYKRTSETPYGTVGQQNERLATARRLAESPPPEPDLNPQNPVEEALFGPSRRPDEPITFGLPVGPGPMGTPPPDEDEKLRSFMRGLAADPNAPAEVQMFAERVERGE